jgi:multisubunit Na+/H+ antiporter MnhB subunit
MNLSFLTDFFRDRVFGHLPSTVVGAIASIAVALATYIQALPVDPKWSLAVYIGSGVLFALAAAYKKPEPPPAVNP